MIPNSISLLVSIILLFGYAGTVQVDGSDEKPQRDDSVHVLTSGEIDSNKVTVGAYVEITYAKGEKLDTVRGHIKAVAAETLTIGRGLWQEQVAFARIQTLIVGASDHSIDRYKASVDLVKYKDPIIQRLAMKSLLGALTGTFSMVAGIKIGSAPEGAAVIAGGSVFTVGVSIGVTLADPQDRFLLTLAGSVIGGAVGFAGMAIDDSFWPAVLLCPLPGSIIMSELWRTSLESRRFSLGLVPTSNGRIVAQATLRF